MKSEVILFMWPEADGLASSSPYCLKVLYALKYKKIPHKVEYAIHKLPAWMKRGKLPVAEIGTKQIEDSTSILHELDQLDSDSPRLYPKDPDQNAETTLIEEWADETLTLPMVYYRWAKPEHFSKFAPQVTRFAPEEMRQKAADAALEYHLAMFAERGIGQAPEEERRENYARALGVLEQKLTRNSFLTGPGPTAADFASFPSLQIALAGRLSELSSAIEARPRISAWIESMRELTV